MFHSFITSPVSASADVPAAATLQPALIVKPAAQIALGRRSGVMMQGSPFNNDAIQRRYAQSIGAPFDTASTSGSSMPCQRLQQLGSIGIVNGGGAEPTPAAMDLLALGLGRSVAIACDETPPNLLNDFPAAVTNVVATTQVGAVAAADTLFLLECTTAKIIQHAKTIKPHGRVVIAGGALHQVAEQVAVLHELRPDVDIFGHAASEFALYASSAAADPVQASHATAAVLNGQAATLVRPLCSEDARWISERTGCPVAPGIAIAAPFLKDGHLDRTLCAPLLASPKTGLKDAIEQLESLQQDRPAALSAAIRAASKECAEAEAIRRTPRAPRAPGIAPDMVEVMRRIALLGPTVIYGANGKIGSAMLKFLAEAGIPLCGIMRKPDRAFLRGFDSPLFNLIIANKVPDDFPASTAFVTASTGWKKDVAGNIIFDRSKLLLDNIAIVAAQLAQLPPDIQRVILISNPSTEMAFVAWLLRPDLVEKFFAHAGTDATRQINRVRDPHDTSHYGTAGPHSPMQVNWEMKNTPVLQPLSAARSAGDPLAASAVTPARRTGRIDPRIPLLGQLHQSRSRDKNSVTVPTAAAAIFEAINIASHEPQNYARPLTLREAERLTTLMAQYNHTLPIHEGVAPTLPRDAACAIRWEMLTEALDAVPGFADKLCGALQAVEEGRSASLDALKEKINAGRSDDDRVGHDWIIAHRGPVLLEAIVPSKK